jgi:hypothetical protein
MKNHLISVIAVSARTKTLVTADGLRMSTTHKASKLFSARDMFFYHTKYVCVSTHENKTINNCVSVMSPQHLDG